MRAVRTNAIRSRLSALLALWPPCRAVRGCGLDGEQCPGRGRTPAPARDPVFARPSDRCRSGAVRDGRRPAACSAPEGLAVTTNIASGSPDAIARVAAGTSDFALVDINALMRFRDKDKQGGPRIKAVFVLFNKAPYAIIARKSRGIHALSDIEGKTLGVAEGDLSIRLWPAVAKQNGIKHQEREAEQHQRRGARADAVGGPDRCRDRIFLSVGDQSEGPRRAGRRSGGAEIRRLWLRGLWLRGHRQSGAGGRQARGGEGIRAGGDRRPASDDQGPRRRRGRSRQPHGRRLEATSNSNACKPSCATTS